MGHKAAADTHTHTQWAEREVLFKTFSLRWTVIYRTLDLQGKIMTGQSYGNCQCAE